MIPGNSAEGTSIVVEQELLEVSAFIVVRLVMVVLLDGLPLEGLNRVKYEFSEMTTVDIPWNRS